MATRRERAPLTEVRWPDIIIGATYPIPFLVTDPVTDDPVDVSGWEYDLIIETALDDSDADQILNFTHVAPADADSVAGQVTVQISVAQTTAIAAGEYYMKMWRRITTENPEDKRLIGPYKVTAKTGN